MISAWWRKHGDALRLKLSLKTLYLFSHPNLVENIFASAVRPIRESV
jgi:hypothetical protein